MGEKVREQDRKIKEQDEKNRELVEKMARMREEFLEVAAERHSLKVQVAQYEMDCLRANMDSI